MGKYMPDDLEELPGVGPATAEKLRENGYNSYDAIAVASAGELSTEADVGESTAQKVINAAREAADIGGFESGTDLLERRRQVGKLKFNIPEVDELLGGGIETQNISEFYGEFGAGKSQITQQLSVNVQLPEEHGGLGGSCVFIDTEDTFRPRRIAGMVRGLEEEVLETVLDERGFDYSVDDIKESDFTSTDTPSETPLDELAESFLSNIKVARAANANHQMMLTEEASEIAEDAKETEWPVRLLVVDSLTACFRAEYVGRGELADRQQKLNKHMHDILQVADLYNAAAVVTNQVSANPDSYFGDPTQPIGGNILGHTSTVRVYLRKSKDNKRIARLVDAPDLADGEAPFKVTDAGLKPE